MLPDETQTEPASQPENELAARLMKRIDTAENHWKKHWQRIEKDRKYAKGELDMNKDGTEVETNLIFSTIQGLMPSVYAKNPEMAVTPSESVSDERYTWVRPFSRTAEICLNRQFLDAGLKQLAKHSVRSALISRIAWAKMTWQEDYARDPYIEMRIDDAQDNLAKLRALQQKLSDPDAEQEGYIQELEQLIAALNEQAEVLVGSGLTLDFRSAKDVIMDPSLNALFQYPRSRWMAEKLWLGRDEAEERLGRDLAAATEYQWRDQAEDEYTPVGGADVQARDPLVLVYEMWDKSLLRIFTMVKGLKDWAREPFTPEYVGEQWYPWHPLAFFVTDGDLWPLSLVDLLRNLQEEYRDTRTQQKKHREASIPTWLADKGIGENDLESFTFAKSKEVILVDANGQPLNQVFQPAQPPPWNPGIYDTSAIRADIDMVSGLQDAARGAVNKAKTATEAEILQQGLIGRAGEMQDTIEDWLQAMSKYALEMMLRAMPTAQAERIAGPGAIWPQLPVDEIFDLVVVEIRSGSTGKPNKRQEQETWIKLMPLLQRLIAEINQLRMSGMPTDPLEALLEETLHRFDERMDIERFLMPEQGQGMMGVPGMAAFMGQGGAPAPGGRQALPAQGVPAGSNVIPMYQRGAM